MALFDDLRFALRMLRSTPGYTAVTLLVLALGIGANVVVFSVADAWLFNSVPFDRNERLVFVTSRNAVRPSQVGAISYPDLADWRTSMKTLEQIGAVGISQASMNDRVDLPEVIRRRN